MFVAASGADLQLEIICLFNYPDSWGSRRSRVRSCRTSGPPRRADTHTDPSPGHSWDSGSRRGSTGRLETETGVTHRPRNVAAGWGRATDLTFTCKATCSVLKTRL